MMLAETLVVRKTTCKDNEIFFGNGSQNYCLYNI
jgi:hypothetical protein